MVGIIILNYNNYLDTINCIDSIIKYNTADVKIIVVDNASTNKEVLPSLILYLQSSFNDFKIIEENSILADSFFLPKVSLIKSKENNGYGNGNNKGLRFLYADHEIDKVLILNNDVLFIEDIIPTLSLFIDSNINSALVSPLLYKKNLEGIDYNCARKCHTEWEIIFTNFWVNRDPFNLIAKLKKSRLYLYRYPHLMDKQYFEIELPSGSCMMIAKNLMKELSGFDPYTFLYFEENILFKKVQKLGKKNYLLPTLRCIHLGAKSTTSFRSVVSPYSNSFISSMYYLENFCDLSLLQKIFVTVAKLNSLIYYFIHRLLK